MPSLAPSVISIGYGRHLFVASNPERLRMELCAAETKVLHMIIFTHQKDGLHETNGQHNLVLHPTQSRHRLLMPFDAWRMGRSIRNANQGISIVTTQDPFEAGLVGYLLTRSKGLRLVVQEHGDVFSSNFWRLESCGNWLRFYFGQWILHQADLVRVVGERTEHNFKKRRIGPIKKLPVAIDASSFIEAHSDPLVQTLFGPDTFVFLSVARFVPQKNIPLMIAAFKIAHARNQNLRLLLVGSGPLESEIVSLVKSEFVANEHTTCPVQILPWTNNVAGLMKASSAYLLSSNYEGWGRVLIEAILAKLPIVTTDVGCAQEVIKDGMHGIVVPVDSTPSLAGAIEKIATDTHFRVGIVEAINLMRPSDIPGTNLADYGRDWVHSLQP